MKTMFIVYDIIISFSLFSLLNRLIIYLFRYRVYLGEDFLFELNLLPASINTIVIQRNSGHIVSI